MSTFKKNLFIIVLLGITMPLGVVVSTHLATRSMERVKIRDQVIVVKGYAEKPITSNLAIWHMEIVARDVELSAASEKLAAAREKTLGFLDGAGFIKDSVTRGQTDISMTYKLDAEGRRTNDIQHYTLRQNLSVSSSDPRLVQKAAQDSDRLIKEGVEFNGYSPSYLYTDLGAVKIDMLAEATRNARERALQLVSNSGGSLGPVRSGSQGVFQITPAHSTEVSSGGMNDTSTIDKMIKAVVTIEYAVTEGAGG